MKQFFKFRPLKYGFFNRVKSLFAEAEIDCYRLDIYFPTEGFCLIKL